MSTADYSIVLRLRHPNADPNEISRQLGVEPQHAWRAGQPRLLDSGEVGEGLYRESCWMGLLSSQTVLQSLLDVLSERRDPRMVGPSLPKVVQPQMELYLTLGKMKRAAVFWRDFVTQGGTIECMIQVHQADRFHFEMSPALLTLCAEFQVALSIEIDGVQRAIAAA